MAPLEALKSCGIEDTREMVAWFWDNRLAAVGTDCPAVEPWPWDFNNEGALHYRTLSMLGLPIGEQFVLDPLAAAMLVMITLVSLCIFVFSIGYMATDRHFTRFFAYLSFFSAAMLGVVIANSLLLLFVCWELVGLASYLLIGFWIHKPSAAAAAKKAARAARLALGASRRKRRGHLDELAATVILQSYLDAHHILDNPRSDDWELR